MQQIPAADTSTEAIDSEPTVATAKRTLSNRSKYRPATSEVRYSDSERDIAMKLALTNLSGLSYIPVKEQDTAWESKGGTSVERYVLEDGTIGYFKSFRENSNEEWTFRDYGVTSLGAAINEVNAYRMAKLLGEGYDQLVPETVLREVCDSLGTLQREVKEDSRLNRDYRTCPQLREDYRRASLFDFVIGNLDRHSDNFIYGFGHTPGGRKSRIRLIDNSFSFPSSSKSGDFNESVFASNRAPGGYYDTTGYTIPRSQLILEDSERAALGRARAGIEDWIAAKTIGQMRGKAAIKRIDFLLKADKLSPLDEYLCGY